MRSIIAIAIAALSAVSSLAQPPIRKVDFNNFTYPAYCASDQTRDLKVTNGEFSEEIEYDGYAERFYYRIFEIVYGDLTGDGREEAVVLGVCNTGGTGNFSEGFVYSMKGSAPALVARIPGGDRAYGGLRSAAVSGGVLSLESNDVGESGGACCPEFVVTTKYRLIGGSLKQVGPSASRELYPKQRIVFEKGSSGTVIKVKIAAQDTKRFVLSARAGQTLTARVSAGEAALRLVDEAEVIEGSNSSFAARLTRSGDHVVEIQNVAELPIEITLTVKIK